MNYSAKVIVKGKTYSIAFTPSTGSVYCVNCGTLRTITSTKTLATIFAAWAEQDHSEALEMNQISVDEAITVVNAAYDAANTDSVWRKLDAHPRSKPLIDNIEYHYVAMRNDAANGGDVTTAPQRLFGFNPGTTAEKAMHAVVGQAEEDFQAMIEADHVQALADDEARDDAELVAAEQWDDWANAHDSRKTEAQMIESDHEEALEINEAINIAVLVIKAMVGHDIEATLSGVRNGLYQNGVNEVNAAGNTALRIAVEESHTEALGEDYRFHKLKARYWDFWASYSESERLDELDEMHTEALEMNSSYKECA